MRTFSLLSRWCRRSCRPWATAMALLPLLVACSHDEGEDFPPVPRKGRIVLHYMAAQNSLGAGSPSFADADLMEMQKGSADMQPGDTLVVLIDDEAAPRIYAFYRNCRTPRLLKQYDADVNTANPATLRDFLTWADRHFENRICGLGFGSHANGWIPSTNHNYYAQHRSIIIDTGAGGSMSNDGDRDGRLAAQMDVADLAGAIEESGLHPDWIFFDACLMQNVETAYALRGVTDYVVAAPMSIAAYGGYYVHLLPRGYFGTSAVDIARTYYTDVTSSEVASLYAGYGFAISVVKTSELDHLAAATRQWLTPLFDGRAEVALSDTLIHYYNYDKWMRYSMPHYYDALDAARSLLPAQAFEQWKQQFDRTVIYRASTDHFWLGPSEFSWMHLDSTRCGAISMFLPQSIYTRHADDGYDWNEKFQHTEWYHAAGWDTTGW